MVSVLRSCPSLKLLGLSMAYEQSFEGSISEPFVANNFIDFIDRLCTDYGSQDHASPLALESLRLGCGMCIYAGHRSDKESIYLNKLVQLESLRKLHIYNGSDRYEADDDSIQIDWQQFQGCTSLRQLSVSRFKRTYETGSTSPVI